MCFNFNFNVIYIREHNSNIIDHVVKLGITTNIIKRNITYITGEYRCGKCIKVYRIYNDNSNSLF